MALDLNKLRTFLEVTRTGSYTLAAERLHVTQSAVSHGIRKLEDGLGCILVDWKGRRFTLTESGEHLRQACERVFRELDQVEKMLQDQGVGRVQTVVLGVTVEFGTTVLLRKMKPLLDAHPGLRVDFRFSHHLEGPLLRDEVDLVVDCKPHLHPAITRTCLFRERYVVISSPEFLLRNPVQTPLELEELPVLSLDKEYRWWANMLSALAPEARPVFRQVVELNHVRGIINAALDGLGVGLVPEYTVLREIEQGLLTVLFPDIRLLEDEFCIYQKTARSQRPGNRLVTDYLLGLKASELGFD